MRPDFVGLGGFDSHTFPPSVRSWVRRCWLIVALCAPHAMWAQVARPSAPRDSLAVKSPISPKRALISSLLVPGLGQAHLDRASGTLFAAVEVISIAMWARSRHSLAVARAFNADSTPLTFATDPATGLPLRDTKTNALVVSEWAFSGFGPDRVHARRVQVEDWAAAIVINHLISGLDAFVAAQLWELPARVALKRTPGGGGIAVRIPW